MVPCTCTEKIRALSPAAQAILQDMGVVFDFQLASLDLEGLDIPAEDLARIRDAVRCSPPKLCDAGRAGADEAVPAVARAISADVGPFRPPNETEDNEPPTDPHTAVSQDDGVPQSSDSVDKDETGEQKGADAPCPRKHPRVSSEGATLPGQSPGTRVSLKRREEDSNCAPHFLIYQSELLYLAAYSAEWDRLETCGDMYGLWTQGNRAVVMLVCGSGPGAIHQVTHCAQDIDFFRANTEFLYDHFGIQYVGPWHSHAWIELDRPSGADAEQIRSISTRNNLSHLVEIITTHRKSERCQISPPLHSPRSDTAPGTWRRPRATRRSESCPQNGICVKINAFEHTDPQTGQCRRCSVRVLPGISPCRLALINSAPLHYAELATQALDFPMDRVLFDPLEHPGCRTEEDTRAGAVPEALVEQCERLPRPVADTLTVTVNEDLIVFKLPTSSEATVLVAYEGQAPHTPKAVGFKPADHKELIDATAYALADGPCLSMDRICAKMASFDPRQSTPAVEAKAPPATEVMVKARTVPEQTENPAEPGNGPGSQDRKR